MKNLFYVITLLLSTQLSAETVKSQEYVMELSKDKQDTKGAIRLDIELDQGDIEDPALKEEMLRNELTTKLQLAQIMPSTEINAPRLVLRIKSIKADRAIATFVQLAFFEEAELLRNKGNIMALTWSKATLISGPKDQQVKEIMQVAADMTNIFIMQYHKAMSH